LTRSRWLGSTCGAIPTTAAIGKNSANGIRHSTRGTGGCGVFENPSLDSREAQPRWLPLPPTVVRLTESDEPAQGAAFSLWRIAGQKTLFHDGVRLFLTTHINHQTLRLSLTNEIRDGGAFALSVPASGELRESWSTIARISALLVSERRPPRRLASRRPSRHALVHMRSLQALDGEAAGASHRDIAAVIFGETDVWRRWASNSELRAQVRYLLRRGHELADGGYHRLLTRTPSEGGQGDLPPPFDSP
jgi:hypothetical protein